MYLLNDSQFKQSFKDLWFNKKNWFQRFWNELYWFKLTAELSREKGFVSKSARSAASGFGLRMAKTAGRPATLPNVTKTILNYPQHYEIECKNDLHLK